MLYSLAYVSRALIAFEDPLRADIGAVSVRNNAALDVTGALYSGPELFFQVLEGDKSAVEGLFSTIRRDHRHKNVTVVRRMAVPRRRFATWTMKVVDPAGLPAQSHMLSYGAFRRAGAGDIERSVALLDDAEVTPPAPASPARRRD